jgi:hypothetical protein
MIGKTVAGGEAEANTAQAEFFWDKRRLLEAKLQKPN